MISIIIVSYKSNERTIQYVRDEVSKIRIPYNVIIVNNAATPDSNSELSSALNADIIPINCRSLKGGGIFVVDNPENSGFAKGNNIGARLAIDVLKSDYLLFSNDDIKYLNSDVVEQLLEKFEQIPQAGIIGPKVIGLQGEYQSPEPYLTFWDRYVWMYVSKYFMSIEKRTKRFGFDYPEKATEGYHYKLMGAFFIVRSNDFDTCGMMDEHTFLYAEETILTERMLMIGKRPYYYPSVCVLHDHGATTGKHLKTNNSFDIQFRSNCYYYRTYKNTPIWQIEFGKLFHFLLKLFK